MTKKIEKKKYRVSLAALVQQNYEVEVEAASDADAVRAAIADFNSGDWSGELVELDFGETKLDVQNEDYKGKDVGKFGGVALWEDVEGSWEDVY